MGCDIHAYAEIKKNGTWTRHMGRLRRDRDYRTFALFANVRNYDGTAFIPPISEPRGLPADSASLADTENLKYEGPRLSSGLGDHSFSWLSWWPRLRVSTGSSR